MRVVECMLEQTYSLLEEALQRLETMVTDTLAELTDPSQCATAHTCVDRPPRRPPLAICTARVPSPQVSGGGGA